MKRSNDYLVRRKYKKWQIVILFLLCMYSISLVSILARYAVGNMSNFFSKSKEFYFNSDKLSTSSPAYQIENWSGVDDYIITVNMNSKDNNLLATNYDIDYEISYKCSDNIICQLSKDTGIISSNSNTDFFNLTITPNTQLQTGDKVEVDITAKATSPYEKTISGRFTLVVGKENITYEIVDSADSPYLELSITNTLSYYIVDEPFDGYQQNEKITGDVYLSLSEEKKKKCYSALISLKFDTNEVMLDMTNNAYLTADNIMSTNINSYEYINGITFKIDAISSVKVRFYKVDELKDYTYPIINSKSVINVSSK